MQQKHTPILRTASPMLSGYSSTNGGTPSKLSAVYRSTRVLCFAARAARNGIRRLGGVLVVDNDIHHRGFSVWSTEMLLIKFI